MRTSASVPTRARGISGLPDAGSLRRGRLARLRAEMAARDCGACVLLDPVNIRYATGARNMQVLVTETGVERLTCFPYEEDLLGREL